MDGRAICTLGGDRKEHVPPEFRETLDEYKERVARESKKEWRELAVPEAEVLAGGE